MGGLFSSKSAAPLPAATSVIDTSAPILAGGVKPAAKKPDELAPIGPTISSALDPRRKSQADALGAAGTPQTIIKPMTSGYG